MTTAVAQLTRLLVNLGLCSVHGTPTDSLILKAPSLFTEWGPQCLTGRTFHGWVHSEAKYLRIFT
jgi:hypothetical protein